ncbi:hypothetical protein BDC45DRAFT_335856 [Circinella umbellata]|nr:hypothetical protein BDC45DRAFT_335856 [Circinella umbellata]
MHEKETKILISCIGILTIISATTYYVIQNDRQMKRRKRARLGQKEAYLLLQQIKRDQQKIQTDLSNNINNEDIDKKKKEYILAQSNELLLQLLERIDAIRPKDAILLSQNNEQEDIVTTIFEEELMQQVKDRKKRIIQSIQIDFDRVDEYKQKLV